MEPSNVKIFISYGRSDASAFVDRLASDLHKAGFETWRDTTHIQPGQSWPAEVAAAIKNSDIMVAILTPHAVRGGRVPVSARDASVCLDELHSARFDPPPTPIIPIMLIPCQAPFMIGLLDWIDFAAAEKDPACYEAALARLIHTIRDVKDGKPVPIKTIAAKPVDFDLYLKEKTRDFVGRQWLTEEILDSLSGEDSAPVLLLVGEPGWGKTAFASHLYRTDPDGHLLAAHFCRADRIDSTSAPRFVESIVALIAMRVASFAERMNGLLATEPDLLSKDPAESFERLVLEPLGALDLDTLRPLPRYLLVDALDESVGGSGAGGLHRLLAHASGLFPDWLRLVATTRDAFGIVERFPSASVVRLDSGDPRNWADVRLLVRQRLASAVDRGPEDAAFMELSAAIETKAQGNALIAAQLSLAASKSGLAADTVRALPHGLSALYRALLERRFDPRGAEWVAARDILEMIMTTDAPLPISLIASARGDQVEYATREAVEGISDLLARHGDAIQLFHQTFREFLQQRTHPFFVNPKTGAARLATVAAAPTPPPALQEFGANRGHVLKRWIAESEDPAQHIGLLPNLYSQEFNRDYRLYETPINADSLPDDVRLIVALAHAGQAGALISVVELAFAIAADRVRAGLAGGTLQQPPPRTAGEFASYFQPAMWLADFGLIWIREIARLVPTEKPNLRNILGRADVFSFFTFFGPALGYRHYHMSGYYEDEADHLSAGYNKLFEELEDAPTGRAETASTQSSGEAASASPRLTLPARAQPTVAAPASSRPASARPIVNEAATIDTPDGTSATARPKLPAWLLQSGEDVGRRAEVLAAWYETELKRDDFADGKTFAGELTEDDTRVIIALAQSGRSDCLARVGNFAFAEALRRFEASGVSTSRERHYTEEQRSRFSQGVESSCRLASFALEWCKVMAGASPEALREVPPILENQQLAPYFYFLGWLDVADGCEVLGMSSYYEYMAASIRLRRSELEGVLRDA
jgi:hypothetical protein